MREVVRSGEPARFTDERDGIVLDSSIYPVFDEQGRVTRLAIFARDVTARKRAEQQAARSERLAASLAHEINNPLQIIRNNLELVQDFDLETEEREARLNIIRSEIDRLAEICQRALDFARPPDDTRYPVPVAHLVGKTLALVNKQLQQAHVQVTTDCPTELPPVFAAPEQITQLLLNLAINAIEAMSEGDHLHIAAHADGDMLALAMTNDGPPIPEEHIERIFEPFFTTKPDGTGLGLSICHGIAQQHGGTISVENLEDDKGVSFTIMLPIARLTKSQETVA
jgi:signal transduction histidine kinase